MNILNREDTKLAGFIMRGLLASKSLDLLHVTKDRGTGWVSMI